MRQSLSYRLGVLTFLLFPLSAFSWPTVFPTGTTVHDAQRAQDGYVLFTPLDNDPGGTSGLIYLINLKGEVVHQWSVPFSPMHGRLLTNGNIVVIGRNDQEVPDRPGVGKYLIGGTAGWLVELDWDGKLVSKHIDLAMHHDFVRLPNGHTLYLAWERVPKKLQQKILGGIKGTEFENGVMWNDKLVEIDGAGKVVWTWSANDHFDPQVDIIGPLYKRQEWFHGNSIDVLSNGNIALTGRHIDSLIIINRKSGRIVRRWGNPAYWDKQTKRIEYRSGKEYMGGPHDAREIPAGFPGAGNVTCFDNGTYLSVSRVVEIKLGSGKLVWNTTPAGIGRKLYSDFVAGAQRLKNGNTFICDGANGRLMQVTPRNAVVWEYINPHVTSPKYQGAIFKAHHYAAGYCPQLAGLPASSQ